MNEPKGVTFIRIMTIIIVIIIIIICINLRFMRGCLNDTLLSKMLTQYVNVGLGVCYSASGLG